MMAGGRMLLPPWSRWSTGSPGAAGGGRVDWVALANAQGAMRYCRAAR